MTTELRPGISLHGFRHYDQVELKELNATLHRFRHDRSGADLCYYACDDPNNLFAATFRTTPEDSTGVAHILEHTVLCGSKHYPVRDPFFSMIKRSLNTFMNALTSSDWTMYPFASMNEKDFDNLLGIYLDACFHPLLRERDFRQEGHRFELAESGNLASDLVLKGVVYNEMKGAMADPSSLAGRRLTKALFPTVTYGKNSGGEPSDIPNLTWEQLRAFHARYYHPSNAFIFLYGNFDLEPRLQQIDAVLSRFESIDPKTGIPDEQRYAAPQVFAESFPLDAGEKTEARSIVQVGWLCSPITDSFKRLAMRILATLLMGDQAAPLYRALIDSGLGTNLSPGGGYHDDIKETAFAIGLQGTEPDRAEGIEKLVLDTLQQIADTGFSPERIDSAIHRLELAQKEVTGDSYPYPLGLAMRMIGPWMHGNDPISPLQLDADLARLREELAKGPLLSNLIRSELLENPHRVRLLLYPDPEQQPREDAAVAERLAKVKAGLTEADLQKIDREAAELQAAQEEKEDLSCLPTLEISDIPPAEREVDGNLEDGCYLFEQPTNGIGYLAAHYDLSQLPEHLLPWVPLYGGMFGNLGAAGKSYTSIAEELAAYTGGIGAGPTLLQAVDSVHGYRPVLTVRGKALNRNQEHLARIARELLTQTDFNDPARIRILLNQIKTSLENSIPGNGHSYAARVAAAGLTASSRVREIWRGLEQLRLVREAATGNDEALRSMIGTFEEIASFIATAPVAIAAIGEDEVLKGAKDLLAGMTAGSPRVAITAPATIGRFNVTPVNKGLSTSVPVAYVATTFSTVPYTDPAAGPLMIAAKLLRAGYLHRELREKGGAYGGFASFDSETGNFSFLSYRDPHIARTLKVYRDSLDWICGGKFTDEEMKEAVLSVFADIDKPQSPNGRGYVEFAERNQELTLEMRNEQRRRILAATRDDIRAAVEFYILDRWDRRSVAVIAGDELLRKEAIPGMVLGQV